MELSKGESQYHEDTELRLGLPGSGCSTKIRAFDACDESGAQNDLQQTSPPKKAQAIGWPPIRSYRKNCLEATTTRMLVKVSMDGAPYLRKIDLKTYRGYGELIKALEEMFTLKDGILVGKRERESDEEEEEDRWPSSSGYEATYEDKDGDWMLVGDVPWQMFATTCNRLRIRSTTQRIIPNLIKADIAH